MTTDTRLPVMLVTGFLGSGKTTLLNRLIGTPAFERSAVVINELGEIAIDQLLVDVPGEQLVVLDNGCVCCSARGDLAGTLRALARGRASASARSRASARRGAAADVPPIDRVLVETTGVADPVPLMETLCEDEEMAALYRAHGIVATVDGVNGVEQLHDFAEPVKQVAVADRLLITKRDMASVAQLDRLESRLRRLNPGAAIVRTVTATTTVAEALGEMWHPEGSGTFDWLARAARVERDHATVAAAHLGRTGNIQTFSLWHDRPVTRAGLVLWLDKLAGLRGTQLLRVKGVLNVEGEPVAVHAVQRIVHEPVSLPSWPDAERRSRLVFITRGLPRAAIEPTLDVLGFALTPTRDGRIDPEAFRRFVAASGRFR